MNQPPPLIVTEILARLAETGESKRSLAKRAGVHYPKLTQWLRGQRSADVATAEAVMRACGLGVKPHDSAERRLP